MNLHRLDELHLPISDQTDSDDMWLQKYNTYSKMDVDMLSNELKPMLAGQSRQQIEFSTSPSLYKATASELSEWKNCALSLKELYKTLEIPLIVIGRDPQHSIAQLPLIVIGRDPQHSIAQLIKGGIPIEEDTT